MENWNQDLITEEMTWIYEKELKIVSKEDMEEDVEYIII